MKVRRSLAWIFAVTWTATLGATPVDAPLASPPVASTSSAAEAALRAGQERLTLGDTKGAEAAWRRGLEAGPDTGLLYALGSLLFQGRRLKEAERCYQRVVQTSPEMADGWYQLGLVRAARGQYKDAADAQRLAVGHAPHFGQAYCALALDLRETGQVAEGLQAVEKAVQLLPTYAGAYNLRGNLKQDRGDLDGAAEDYALALRLESRYAGAWFNRAQLQVKRQQNEEALKSYGYALQVKPAFAEAWLARAELHLELGRLEESQADFSRLSGISGWEPEGLWGRCRVAKAAQRKTEADELLVRYRSAVRRRDRRLSDEQKRGMEEVSSYEPGLPLALSQAPVGGP